jgi:hypothetical protein
VRTFVDFLVEGLASEPWMQCTKREHAESAPDAAELKPR